MRSDSALSEMPPRSVFIFHDCVTGQESTETIQYCVKVARIPTIRWTQRPQTKVFGLLGEGERKLSAERGSLQHILTARIACVSYSPETRAAPHWLHVDTWAYLCTALLLSVNLPRSTTVSLARSAFLVSVLKSRRHAKSILSMPDAASAHSFILSIEYDGLHEDFFSAAKAGFKPSPLDGNPHSTQAQADSSFGYQTRNPAKYSLGIRVCILILILKPRLWSS
ncbi:hypothetical protein R3P38DRAFT_3342273 [Favolaschia claudopus]|uniref:Uncharacterized protein n=1 Tax=Favolaschia claudopus TaxID=2862362 RepID=A0AAW0E6N9_9AGAR